MLSKTLTILALVATLLVDTSAFTAQRSLASNVRNSPSSYLNDVCASSPFQNSIASTETSTTLRERRWNFNEARGPWGMKRNAEIWNGRVAQMGFVVVLLQELIFGKGVVAGIQDGDVGALLMAGLTAVSIVGLSAFLAFKGKENDIVF